MVLDATKPWYHKEILTRELESVGMRLNRWGQVVFGNLVLQLVSAMGTCNVMSCPWRSLRAASP